MKQRRIVVALSGASGVQLGIRLIQSIPKDIECYVITTDSAQEVMLCEAKRELFVFDDSCISAQVASGSFLCESMAVVPCSMNTLAKIASGIADNLTTRTAAVFLKERRKILLAPREMPLSGIALENMQRLFLYGAFIAPPIAAYYAQIRTLEDMENFWVGKWLDILDIQHTLFQRWEG